MAGKKWTEEEERYLQEKWGTITTPGIARHLGRTVAAVKIRAARMGCGPSLMGGEYITLNQLLFAVNGTNAGGSYIRKSWINNRGLPVHKKRVEKNSFLVVYLHEFWEWAEKNRSFLDFSKMEPLALGEEPQWVAEQRKKDFQASSLQRKDPWTPEEDSRLIMLLGQHKYGYRELTEMLRRSAGAIQRRIRDLGLKERPLRADPHGENSKWTDEDFEILADSIRNGESYLAIGKKLDKSEKKIRSKVYYVYLTEDADKVRAMMGNGPFGAGAPVPTVKQAAALTRTRAATKRQLSQLCGVLQYRTQQLKDHDYERYFQRAMCMNWDNIHGKCAAGCEDCDSCTEFARIRPQHCVRCGATFYEKAHNRECRSCRTASI